MLRRIAQYIRQVQCDHDFRLEAEVNRRESPGELPSSAKYIYRCQKCGYTMKIRL